MEILFFVLLGLLLIASTIQRSRSARRKRQLAGVGGASTTNTADTSGNGAKKNSTSGSRWEKVWEQTSCHLYRFLPFALGWGVLLLALSQLYPEIWEKYRGNFGLFWVSQVGLVAVTLLWSVGGRANRWLGWVVVLLILFAFGREMKGMFTSSLSTSKESKAEIQHQLCSAEGQVPFTRALADLNREDPEVMSLPAIRPERCLTLKPEEVEFGRPFVFTYSVSKKGFDAVGTITLRTIRVESDGWERVGYSEVFTNPLDGSVQHQGEGLLWCKNGQCHGVGKDAGGRPLANRLLLRKVIRM